MTISKEAIEAAARALRDEGLDDVGNSPHGWRCEFPDLYPGYCTCVIDIARAALEAAAPLLMAQAWDEGMEAGELHQFKVSRFLLGFPDPYPDDLANPYREEQS